MVERTSELVPGNPHASDRLTMQVEPEQLLTARRMLPLLRSYACELRERSLAIDELESRFGPRKLARTPTSMAGQLIEAQLSTHRRELSRLRRELKRMGWRVDRMQPLQLVLHGADGLPEVTWSPTGPAESVASADAAV